MTYFNRYLILAVLLLHGLPMYSQTEDISFIMSNFRKKEDPAERVKDYNNFKADKNYQSHEKYQLYLQNMEREIATSYAAANDLDKFEYWAARVSSPTLRRFAISQGFEELVKTYNPADLSKALQKHLDRIMQEQPWDNNNRNLSHSLIYCYLAVANPIDCERVFPYLSAIYSESKNYFSSDVSKINSATPLPYQQTLTYIYAKCLAENGKEQEALRVLTQGVTMKLFTLDDVTNNVSDFAAIPQFANRLSEYLEAEESEFSTKVANLLAKNTSTGKPLVFEKETPKYLVIDFWGTWCLPCRASHPKLRELYAKYREQGLEIVSVAHEAPKDMDKIKEGWMDAIETDQMTWPQILNNEGVEEFDAVSAFSVGMFPTKIIVDSNFNKVGVYQGGTASKEMERKLEELFR